ncbi:uncharacterized protein Dwil_GK11869 [Drosophila willistoni]|uniref:Gustatory receptor n=1 Tax=Drosophila willistoni TaxID=7260 RepID=B4NBC4_DROWI|nr:putative gustatory receptor 89a [Drosophila willistoni]EDW81088.1 uncharacterized protein Dwil_GK11869 [Drosophila willistoni]
MPRFPHVCGLCLLFRLWQLLSLAPVAYNDREGVRCRRLLTLSAFLKWLILVAIAPFILMQSAALYKATNVKHSSFFNYIALGTMAGDIGISLILLASHLWQRQQLAHLLNQFVNLHHTTRLSWPATLMLWTKLLLSLYEVLCNIPFLQDSAKRLPWPQLLGYGIELYVQHVSSVYANGIFGGLLLLVANLNELEEEDGQSLPLKRERHWLRMSSKFSSTFQLGIFLLVIGNFINILANMYAYMSYFVSQHGVPLTISNYCIIVAIQLYALVMVAHLCQVRHSRLCRRYLQLGYTPDNLSLEKAMGPTIPLLMSPLGSVKFTILGLFTLDNAFWLFLVSYAVNFIVIILQFTLENMKR